MSCKEVPGQITALVSKVGGETRCCVDLLLICKQHGNKEDAKHLTLVSLQSLAYSRVLEIHKQHLSPVLTAYFPEPLLLHQGHMEWLFDHEGNRYLDFFSGIVTVSVGHCHP